MIEVIGLTARGWEDLPERERALVRSARLVVGGRRHLELVPLGPDQEGRELPRPLRSGFRRLMEERDSIVVLATGDPLLSGVGTTLLAEFGNDQVRIHPALSSVALARARMGWSAESAVTLSLVGRSLDRVRRQVAPGAQLVLLSANQFTPGEVAALLVDAGYGPSPMTVLGNLGTDRESRTSALASEWRGSAPQLNVVCVSCVTDGSVPTYGWTAGLPDSAYEHDGQLTKRDVRAAVLARLAPRPGELLWDLGAGAGSVAIEWCRADTSCLALAVERDPERVRRIERNAARLGVPQLRALYEDIGRPGLFADLPVPDAIFVGGGANSRVLDECWPILGDGGRLVVSAVTLETERVVLDAAARWGGELTRISVEQVQPLGELSGWVPARSVVLWHVTKSVL